MTEEQREQVAAEIQQCCSAGLSEAGYTSVNVTAGPSRDVLTRDLRTGRFHVAQVQSSVFIDLFFSSGNISDVLYEPVAKYPSYHAVALTRRESPIYDLVDLDGRQVACVNQHSMSGYRVPISYLRGVGITPSPVFSSGDDHTDVVRAVLQGEVGSAFTHDGFRTNLRQQDLTALRSLPIPTPIPGAVWIVRSDVAANESLRSRLVMAAMNLAASDDDPYWSVLDKVDVRAVSDYLAFQGILRSSGRREHQ